MSLISISTGIIVGICLYAGTHFVLTFLRVRNFYLVDGRYLLFGAMCYLAVAVVGCELIAYQAQDIDRFIEALRWRSIASICFLILWSWFVYYYTRAVHFGLPVLFSIILSGFVLGNIFTPYGLLFDEFPTLSLLSLPWGETVHFAEFSLNTVGRLIWIVVLAVSLYTFYACVQQYRRGRKRDALTLLLGFLVFIGFTAENYFVRAGLIDFIFLAAYGFPALVVVVGMGLHRNAMQATEFLHAITDYVPASVYIKDRKGRYLMINKVFQDKHQISNEDMQGKTDYDLFEPAIADRYVENDQQVLQQVRPLEFNEVAKNAQGQPQYYQTVKYPLYDANRQAFAVCGISMDVTESRAAQSLVVKTESRYRNLFENASDAIFIIKDGGLQDCNQRACTMFACQREDILGKSLIEFSPEYQPNGMRTVQLILERIAAAMAGEPQLFEWQHRRQDGTLFDAEVNLSCFELDGEMCVQGVVRDITERKQAERDLYKQRELLETSVNATPGGYFMFNTRGVVIFSNQAFQKAVGMSPMELAAINIVDYFVHPDDIHRAYKAIETAIRSNTTVSEQLRIMAGDDEVKYLLATVTRFYIDDEAYLVGAAIDISQRVAAEKELNKYRERLEELVAARTMALEVANQELEAFSYSVSHDLRAPLRTINGFSRALMDEYGERLDADGRKYLSRVMDSSIHMANLIDDLLKLSRINRSSLVLTEVDMSSMATSIIQNLQSDSSKRQAEVHIRPDMTVTADKRLLEIMLTNLLDNAWKYTSRVDRAEIEMGCYQANDETIYYVRDNGAGFDMRYADNLFSAFQRLHGDDFPGTGIGLATVARVLHRHGGHIWAEARPNEGATFYFKLNPPISDEQLATYTIDKVAGGTR